MLAELFRKPERDEKLKRARARLEVLKKTNRLIRKQTHILNELKRRAATPSDTDATQRTDGHDAGMDTPINTFHEWELRALDRELVELPRSDLNQRLEDIERELAAIHDPGIRKREHDYFLLSDEPKDAPTLGETDIPVQYMVDYMENTGNLSDFLQDFPAVNMPDAINGMMDYVRAEIPDHVHLNRESGSPIFRGSKDRMRGMFEFLAAGRSLNDYLYPLSSPSRRQVTRTLKLACLLMEAMAYENAAMLGADYWQHLEKEHGMARSIAVQHDRS